MGGPRAGSGRAQGSWARGSDNCIQQELGAQASGFVRLEWLEPCDEYQGPLSGTSLIIYNRFRDWVDRAMQHSDPEHVGVNLRVGVCRRYDIVFGGAASRKDARWRCAKLAAAYAMEMRQGWQG